MAISDGVIQLTVGNRVNLHFYSPNEPDYFLGSPLPGGLAEYMTISKIGAVRIPDNLSDKDASTLPITTPMDLYALVGYGQV